MIDPASEARWKEKTDARLFDENGFMKLKAERSIFVLGVMGFAGAWSKTKLKGAALQAHVAAVKSALQEELLAHQKAHGPKLVVSSGATDHGVLKLTYELCDELAILSMGVTPARTLAYPVGRMDYLIPHGQRYGDESQVFLRTSDAFLLLGGGPQSERETREGHARGAEVTIIQGFGGVADQLDKEALPQARFIKRGSES